MHDSLLVRRVECLRELGGDGQRLLERNRSLGEALCEVFAFHELHRQCDDSACVLEPVDRRDVRMIQRGEHLRLAPEAGDSLWIGREGLGQDLDRDLATELGVAGAIHLAHAASADGGEDLVRTDVGTGAQGQARGLYAPAAGEAARGRSSFAFQGRAVDVREACPPVPVCHIYREPHNDAGVSGRWLTRAVSAPAEPESIACI